jgi:hypothetical protein
MIKDYLIHRNIVIEQFSSLLYYSIYIYKVGGRRGKQIMGRRADEGGEEG